MNVTSVAPFVASSGWQKQFGQGTAVTPVKCHIDAIVACGKAAIRRAYRMPPMLSTRPGKKSERGSPLALPRDGLGLAKTAKADIFVVDEEARQPIDRPWLTLAMDVCSRMVMGFYFTMDSPPDYRPVSVCCTACSTNRLGCGSARSANGGRSRGCQRHCMSTTARRTPLACLSTRKTGARSAEPLARSSAWNANAFHRQLWRQRYGQDDDYAALP